MQWYLQSYLAIFQFVLYTIFTTQAADRTKHKLLVVMLDGFRWDYADALPPDYAGFRQIKRKGVKAEYVKPTFPSLTCPGWTTIATGVYPETHGVLGNVVFDRSSNKTMDCLDPNLKRLPDWYRTEPFWITAVKHGLKVADLAFDCLFSINGHIPHVCDSGRSGANPLTFRGHLDRSIQLFTEGFDLVLVYTPLIDVLGHFSSDNRGFLQGLLRIAVRLIDSYLEIYLEKLFDSGLKDEVNIVLVSDHGMTDIDSTSYVTVHYLEDFVDIDRFIIKMLDVDGGFMQIFTKPGRTIELYDQLKTIRGITPYLAHEIPERLHYRNNRNVADIVILSNPGFVIFSTRTLDTVYKPPILSSTHDYDSTRFFDMWSIFYAIGPAFKKNKTIPWLNMVDLYQIFTKVLNIPGHDHNGTWSHVSDIFRE